MGYSISVHRRFPHDPLGMDEIQCVGSPGCHMRPKGISPHCLYGFPEMAF